MDNISSIYNIKTDRLKKENYFKLIDEFECLRLRLDSREVLQPKEIERLIIICKFLMKNGKTEYTKLSCKKYYAKYGKALDNLLSITIGTKNAAQNVVLPK